MDRWNNKKSNHLHAYSNKKIPHPQKPISNENHEEDNNISQTNSQQNSVRSRSESPDRDLITSVQTINKIIAQSLTSPDCFDIMFIEENNEEEEITSKMMPTRRKNSNEMFICDDTTEGGGGEGPNQIEDEGKCRKYHLNKQTSSNINDSNNNTIITNDYQKTMRHEDVNDKSGGVVNGDYTKNTFKKAKKKKSISISLTKPPPSPETTQIIRVDVLTTTSEISSIDESNHDDGNNVFDSTGVASIGKVI